MPGTIYIIFAYGMVGVGVDIADANAYHSAIRMLGTTSVFTYSVRRGAGDHDRMHITRHTHIHIFPVAIGLWSTNFGIRML